MATVIDVLQDRQYVMPSAADTSAVTTHGAWTWSDWVELEASMNADSVLTGILAWTNMAGTANLNTPIDVQIGVGTAGNETEISTFRTHHARGVNDPSAQGDVFIPSVVGIDALSSGDRVSYRMQWGSTVDPVTLRGKATYIEKPLTGALFTTTDPMQCLPFGTTNYTLTTGTTSYVFTSWDEIRAASGPSMYITYAVVHQITNLTLMEIEFGIGSASSETTIYRWVDIGGIKGNQSGAGRPFYNPIYVPANARLAWRIRCNANAARTATLSINYVESITNP
jgi:hypothetical protein